VAKKKTASNRRSSGRKARTAEDGRPLVVVLGNQLFPPAHLDGVEGIDDARIFMAEDVGLCTYVRHHQQKIALFLAAMRHHADELRSRDLDVTYLRLDDDGADDPYEDKLDRMVDEERPSRLVTFEIEDRFFAERIAAWADGHDLEHEVRPSPMFVTPRPVFADYLDSVKAPFMATFYQRQRKATNILLEEDGSPVGGKWSFDDENRRKLPKSVEVPDPPTPTRSDHDEAVIALVRDRFPDHPGDADGLWLPTTRRSALAWYRRFLDERLEKFGDYEDALTTRSDTVFHSVLSPLLNLGLLTPEEVVDRALEHAEEHAIPLNSLEGFVRQMIGWREFIRGIYHAYDEEQQRANFWGHERRMKPCWWDGTTGLDPLDHSIRTALRLGWTHHIERLMILSNLMNLCEIEPREAHRWFMEMYVDSSDWVMGPNVYGMGLFSDGGIFSTKPYLCGSNYVLKMSDYGRGDWCETMDGLYWRFVEKHLDFFRGNPRLSVMPRALAKLDPERKKRIFARAEAFIDEVTEPG